MNEYLRKGSISPENSQKFRHETMKNSRQGEKVCNNPAAKKKTVVICSKLNSECIDWFKYESTMIVNLQSLVSDTVLPVYKLDIVMGGSSDKFIFLQNSVSLRDIRNEKNVEFRANLKST